MDWNNLMSWIVSISICGLVICFYLVYIGYILDIYIYIYTYMYIFWGGVYSLYMIDMCLMFLQKTEATTPKTTFGISSNDRVHSVFSELEKIRACIRSTLLLVLICALHCWLPERSTSNTASQLAETRRGGGTALVQVARALTGRCGAPEGNNV